MQVQNLIDKLDNYVSANPYSCASVYWIPPTGEWLDVVGVSLSEDEVRLDTTSSDTLKPMTVKTFLSELEPFAEHTLVAGPPFQPVSGIAWSPDHSQIMVFSK